MDDPAKRTAAGLQFWKGDVQVTSLKTIIDFGELGEIECEVEYDYTPGDPGRWYLPNGDPGEPPTAEEIDITCITTVSGVNVTRLIVGTKACDSLIDAISEREAERPGEAAAEMADALNDERLLREHLDQVKNRCE
jgi:hypothetical protein